jgi:hypothetical protein
MNPIPLRPSPDALRESALASIAKACVYMAKMLAGRINQSLVIAWPKCW